jgi:hypothetical protein
MARPVSVLRVFVREIEGGREVRRAGAHAFGRFILTLPIHASAPVPAPAVDTDATDYVNLQRPSYYRQNHKVPCRAHAHDLSHSRKLLSLFHPSYLTSPTHRIHGKTTAGPGSQQKAIPGNELGWRGVTVMLTVMLLPAY